MALEDEQFARLLIFFNYSWKGYRKVRKGVKKRVARHMQELGCPRMDNYLERLQSDPEARAECERRLTVSISRFFRDLFLWQTLSKNILPELLRQRHPRIKVWFAGCGNGEEVYSFRIIWEEWITRYPEPPQPQLTATDKNPQYIERAKEGIYSSGALREVDEKRQTRWFKKIKTQTFAVAPALKQGIDWQHHDLLTNVPPGTGFDIVFVRNNLLTYYQEDLIRKPIERIIDEMAPGGFFIIGAKEEMPLEAKRKLRPYDRCIFRRSA